MRRWHEERDLMMRRWRMELATHMGACIGPDRRPNQEWPAPPAVSCDVDCHCANGIGTMRKNRVYGCGNPRCGICHFEKYYVPKRRGARKRAEINFDLEAEA